MHASSGPWDFLEQILEKLPSSIASTRTRVRLDGAFYDKKIVESLDPRHLGYAIVARMSRPLRNKMVQARYHRFARGWEAAEFTYTPFHWKAEHRYVAVRRPVVLEPEEIQKRLFTFRDYTYHRALVTNLELTPEADSSSWICARARRRFRFATVARLAPRPPRRASARH